MSDNILVCAAWPYANGPIHHGQLGGAYLPADIFARYHRIRGNRVAMVSGSDTHGTPITVRADDEGRTPAEVVAEYHQSILDTWEGMGISFDTFTTTMTDNHEEAVHGLFNALLEHDYLYKTDPGPVFTTLRLDASCPTATSKASVHTATSHVPGVTSATLAAANSTRLT